MIKYVKTINSTYHIALYNHENSFCHHIAVVQCLHASETLNTLLRKMNLNTLDEYIVDVLKPLYVYSLYEPNKNELETYSSIKEYYEYYVEKYVSENGKHGYEPLKVLVYLFLPVIYNVFKNDFVQIISELHIDKISFNNIDYVIEDNILNEQNAFLKSPYKEQCYELYKTFINNVPTKYNKKHFVASVLEVYPNKDNTGGHAITLLKGFDKNFYIIDDQNAIMKMEEYYKQRKERIYRISVRNIDEITIANLNAILHARCEIADECSFSKRVTRYELNFEHNFLTVNENDILKNEYKENKVEESLYTSNVSNEHDNKYVDKYVDKYANEYDDTFNAYTSNNAFNDEYNKYNIIQHGSATDYNVSSNNEYNDSYTSSNTTKSITRYILIFIIGLIIGIIITSIINNIKHANSSSNTVSNNK